MVFTPTIILSWFVELQMYTQFPLPAVLVLATLNLVLMCYILLPELKFSGGGRLCPAAELDVGAASFHELGGGDPEQLI